MLNKRRVLTLLVPFIIFIIGAVLLATPLLLYKIFTIKINNMTRVFLKVKRCC